jgi:hypothetical protein
MIQGTGSEHILWHSSSWNKKGRGDIQIRDNMKMDVVDIQISLK